MSWQDDPIVGGAAVMDQPAAPAQRRPAAWEGDPVVGQAAPMSSGQARLNDFAAPPAPMNPQMGQPDLGPMAQDDPYAGFSRVVRQNVDLQNDRITQRAGLLREADREKWRNGLLGGNEGHYFPLDLPPGTPQPQLNGPARIAEFDAGQRPPDLDINDPSVDELAKRAGVAPGMLAYQRRVKPVGPDGKPIGPIPQFTESATIPDAAWFATGPTGGGAEDAQGNPTYYKIGPGRFMVRADLIPPTPAGHENSAKEDIINLGAEIPANVQRFGGGVTGMIGTGISNFGGAIRKYLPGTDGIADAIQSSGEGIARGGEHLIAGADQEIAEHPVQSTAGKLGVGLAGLAGDVAVGALTGGPGFVASFAGRSAGDMYANSRAQGESRESAARKGGLAAVTAILAGKIGHLFPAQAGQEALEQVVKSYLGTAGMVGAQATADAFILNHGTGKPVDLSHILPEAMTQGFIGVGMHGAGMLGQRGGAESRQSTGVIEPKTQVNPAGAIENGGGEQAGRAPVDAQQQVIPDFRKSGNPIDQEQPHAPPAPEPPALAAEVPRPGEAAPDPNRGVAPPAERPAPPQPEPGRAADAAGEVAQAAEGMSLAERQAAANEGLKAMPAVESEEARRTREMQEMSEEDFQKWSDGVLKDFPNDLHPGSERGRDQALASRAGDYSLSPEEEAANAAIAHEMFPSLTDDMAADRESGKSRRDVKVGGERAGYIDTAPSEADAQTARSMFPDAGIAEGDTVSRIHGIEVNADQRGAGHGQRLYLQAMADGGWLYNSQAEPGAVRAIDALERKGLAEVHWKGGKGGVHLMRITQKGRQFLANEGLRAKSPEQPNPGRAAQGQQEEQPGRDGDGHGEVVGAAEGHGGQLTTAGRQAAANDKLKGASKRETAAEPEHIAQAAIRRRDTGEIFEGLNHPDAYEKAGYDRGTFNFDEWEEGMTTDRGRFVTNAEAIAGVRDGTLLGSNRPKPQYDEGGAVIKPGGTPTAEAAPTKASPAEPARPAPPAREAAPKKPSTAKERKPLEDKLRHAVATSAEFHEDLLHRRSATNPKESNRQRGFQKAVTVGQRVAQGSLEPKALVDLETAKELARSLPPDHPAAITLRELEALEAGDRGGRPTSIKNEVVGRERERRGIEPAAKPGARSHDEVWEDAKRDIEENPELAPDLIRQINDNPRAITDHEAAIIGHRQVQLQNEFDANAKGIVEAHDAGDVGRREELRIRQAVLSDKLLEVYKAGKSAGTESGRGLAARQMMLNRDFSLAAVETRLRAARGGEPLTSAERETITKLTAEKADAQAKYDKLFTEHQKTVAELALKARHAEVLAAAAREDARAKDLPKETTKIAKPGKYGASNKLVTAESYANILKDLRGKTYSIETLTGEVLKSLVKAATYHVEAGARKFAEFSKRMIADLGERVRPHLDDLYAKANAELEKGRKDDVAGRIKQRVADGEAVPGRLIQALHKMVVREGITDREKAVDAVHAIVKESAPSMTRQDTANAMAGYGDFRGLDKSADAAQVRAHKGELRELAKLDDLLGGQAPKKSGVERAEPTNEERKIRKQVEDAKRKLGIQAVDPATQLKSTLDGIKSRLRNEAADLEDQLATGKVLEREGAAVPWDKEAIDLRERRDAAKEMYDEAFGGQKQADPAKQADALSRALDQRIAREQAKLDNFDLKPDAKAATVPTEAVAARRAHLELLRQQRDALRNLTKPQPSPDQVAIDAKRTRLLESIADKADRIARDDYAKAPKPNPAATSRELERLTAENERLGNQIRQGEENARLKGRGSIERKLDFFVKLRRANVLSSPTTLAKLTSAAGELMTFMPAEEAVGGLVSKLIPGVAGKASNEGGFNARAIGRSVASFFTEGMRDAWQNLKNKPSALELAYGDPLHGMPREWIDYLGSLHGALKAPVKRAAFALALEKATAHAVGEGLDVTDPAVMMRLSKDAYLEANRRIFMESNAAAETFNDAVAKWERVNPETGKPSPFGKAAAVTAKMLLPIVRIPTNIVKQVAEASIGTAIGGVRLAAAYARGIESLDPATANSIMRNFKKGLIGNAFMALGYFGAGSVGGYYQPGEKRDKDDTKVGRVKIFGVQIPSLLMHNPFLEAMQIGATIRRVADSRKRKSDAETEGLGAGSWAAAMGLVEELPFARTAGELGKFENKPMEVAGKLAASVAVPAAATFVAKQMDPNGDDGESVRRKPEGFTENFKMAVPGLRQQVPERVEHAERTQIREPREGDDNPMRGGTVESVVTKYQRMSAGDRAKYREDIESRIDAANVSDADKARLRRQAGL